MKHRLTDGLKIESEKRRSLLRGVGAGISLGLFPLGMLAGCSSSKEPILRIASNVFPGYELLYLAEARGYFSRDHARMVDMPSSTACLQALAAGTVEGAALTLDEVISATADNLPLKVVAVLDVSLGADVLLVSPEIKTLAELRDKRIGVEQSAVGAVMLDAVLNAAGLKTQDVKLIYATVDQHHDLYVSNKVDALVTFEPLPKLLAGKGARQLYDSSKVPGRIVDVLAVRPEVLERSPKALRQLLAGHFKALAELRSNPQSASEVIAKRLKIPPSEVPSAFNGLELPDAAANLAWFAGSPSKLDKTLVDLQAVMLKAGLINRTSDLKNIGEPVFLPGGKQG